MIQILTQDEFLDTIPKHRIDIEVTTDYKVEDSQKNIYDAMVSRGANSPKSQIQTYSPIDQSLFIDNRGSLLWANIISAGAKENHIDSSITKAMPQSNQTVQRATSATAAKPAPFAL